MRIGKTISREDLKALHDLKVLVLDNNELRSLPSDLFASHSLATSWNFSVRNCWSL
jgi:Leucine-rich repeat (LRR) protein